MRMLKKISLISFLFIIVFVLVGSFDIKTSSQTLTEYNNLVTVKGAGIRTSGNQGLRFECHTDHIIIGPSDKEYGAFIAYGSKNSSGVDLTSEMIADAYLAGTNINDHNVLKAYTSEVDSDGTYYVTIFNIPEDYYLQDITVVPFTCAAQVDYLFGEAVVTRNLGEIALAYLNDGGTKTTLLDNIVTKLDTDYRKKIELAFPHLIIDSLAYESDITYIYQEFIEDWNKEYPILTITNNCSEDSFVTILSCTGSNYNPYAFVGFFRKYIDKYGWLLDIISDKVDDTNIDGIANAIKSQTTFEYSDAYIVVQFLSILYGMLNGVTTTTSMGFEFNITNNTNFNIYISSYNNGVYTNLLDENRTIEILKSDAEITLPEIECVGYWFANEYNKNDLANIYCREYHSNSEFNLNENYFYCMVKDICEENKNELSNDIDFANGTISISPNTKIIGNGHVLTNAKIVLCEKAKTVTFKDVTFNNCSIEKQAVELGYKGCTIKDITFDNCTFITSNILFTENDDNYNMNITFKDCTFNDGNKEYVSITNNKNITFTGCTFNNAVIRPIRLLCSTNSNGINGTITVTNCAFNDNSNVRPFNAIYVDKLDNANNGRIETSGNSITDNDNNSCLLYVGAVTDYINAHTIKIYDYLVNDYYIKCATSLQCDIRGSVYGIGPTGKKHSGLNAE